MTRGPFCEYCGKENGAAARFCNSCGRPLAANIPSAPSTEAVQEQVTSHQPKQGESAGVFPYLMVGLFFLLSIITYLDRDNISIAAPVIMQELDWDRSVFGLIFTALLLGYALLAFPGGVLVDHWNASQRLSGNC